MIVISIYLKHEKNRRFYCYYFASIVAIFHWGAAFFSTTLHIHFIYNIKKHSDHWRKGITTEMKK